MSAADNSPPKALADDILADLSASPRRIRRESARIRLDPPRIRRDPPDVRRTSAKKIFGGLLADPGGSAAYKCPPPIEPITQPVNPNQINPDNEL